MRIGRFSDDNLALTATLSGGTWSGALPLNNLKDETRFISAPARQLEPADEESAMFEAVLARSRTVNLIGLMFHTMGINAEYRVTIAPPAGTLAAPSYEGDWTPVHTRLFDSEALAWEDENWWTGEASAEEVSLYTRHLWIDLSPGVPASAVRVELRDPDAAYFDIGGLWIAAAWSPRFNFDHGREVGMDARSLADEAPSGRVFHEDRPSRRRVSVTWSMLDKAEAYRLFDAGQRCGTRRPVVFLPDPGDAVSLIREAFPATFEKPPAPRLGRRFNHTLSATFKEIIA